MSSSTNNNTDTVDTTTTVDTVSTLTTFKRVCDQADQISLEYLPYGYANKEKANTTVIVGLHYGDEGKGRVVQEYCAALPDMFVARCNGGANAGHTIVENGIKYPLHLIPCGVTNPNAQLVMGNGVFVDFTVLQNEIEMLESHDIKCMHRLFISSKAHLVFSYHKIQDVLRELQRGSHAIGTTGKGIGPCAGDQALREGIRVGELLDMNKFICHFESNWAKAFNIYYSLSTKDKEVVDSKIKMEDGKSFTDSNFWDVIEYYTDVAAKFKNNICDTGRFIRSAFHGKNNHIVIELANAFGIDLHQGSDYPNVTSSTCTSSAALLGLGMNCFMIHNVVGVVKAYMTRVGNGSFVTEDLTDVGQMLRDKGHEYGTTTGRPRRCGWFDVPFTLEANAINGTTLMAVTKLDVLSGMEKIPVCTKYNPDGTPFYEYLAGWTEDITEIRAWNDLPTNTKNYVKTLARLCKCCIGWVGVGPQKGALLRVF